MGFKNFEEIKSNKWLRIILKVYNIFLFKLKSEYLKLKKKKDSF